MVPLNLERAVDCYYPTRPTKMMGKMTVSYGIAQILAPAITGLLAERSGSCSDGLYLAAAMMIGGSLLIMKLRVMGRNDTMAFASEPIH